VGADDVAGVDLGHGFRSVVSDVRLARHGHHRDAGKQQLLKEFHRGSGGLLNVEARASCPTEFSMSNQLREILEA
jgi:hypothetical protein